MSKPRRRRPPTPFDFLEAIRFEPVGSKVRAIFPDTVAGVPWPENAPSNAVTSVAFIKRVRVQLLRICAKMEWAERVARGQAGAASIRRKEPPP